MEMTTPGSKEKCNRILDKDKNTDGNVEINKDNVLSITKI
jgi:hypothetical protein